MKISLTLQAHRDIAAIKEYIEADNPGIAVRVAKELYSKAESLAENPYKGVELERKFGIHTDLRMLIVSPNLILYKITEDKIIVTRIVDARTDYLSTIEQPVNSNVKNDR